MLRVLESSLLQNLEVVECSVLLAQATYNMNDLQQASLLHVTYFEKRQTRPEMNNKLILTFVMVNAGQRFLSPSFHPSTPFVFCILDVVHGPLRETENTK
ncbi:UNVERIFIED_CONTAM: hypothetical protein Sradi_2884900 [Sesamum radiatum]|uniref:Uncharacterized protein n=1 Tax=Sesamum radiatum TaxID=300843 RepID=A0AAW2RX84_SESRA